MSLESSECQQETGHEEKTPPEAEAKRREGIWKRAYAAKTREDLMALYADWARTYDQDHEAIGFVGHRVAADLLNRFVPFHDVVSIIDAGAGTGAAGLALSEHGYRNITALDLSQEMLDRAAEKGVYRDLFQRDLGAPLDDFPADHFDAAIMVGVFSYGQAPAHTLDEIIRIVKPGGVIVFTMRVDFFEQDAMGVRSVMEEYERRFAWKLLELTPPLKYLPKKDPEAKFRVWAYRVLETKRPPVDESFATAVREALSTEGSTKRIDHSFIWDPTSSRLYEDYTRCEGYYLTDAELEILSRRASDILGDESLIVELGCGSATKINTLMGAAHEQATNQSHTYTYMPIDVSEGALASTQRDVEQTTGDFVRVVPRCGRFDDILATVPISESKIIVFFGSSLGNIESLEATVAFLETVRDRMGPKDRFVIGLDLDKPIDVFREAYEAGPSNRAFFVHMIRRINNELGTNLDLGAFEQRSPYEPDEPYRGLETSCVELRLVSTRPQDFYVSSLYMEGHLDEGDAIQVGTSRKFKRKDIKTMAELAGLRLTQQWFDERSYFSLNEMVRKDDSER